MDTTTAYITAEDVRLYAWQGAQDDEPLLNALRVRASRLFDILCYVPAEYFQTFSATAEARVIYGYGSVYLDVPPHYEPIAADAVTMPTGYTVPHWVEIENSLRVTTEAGVVYGAMDLSRTCWPKGVPVTVSAKWGFPAVPEDVKEAVVELTMTMWRSKDFAFTKAVDLANNVQLLGAIPERTKMVAAFYQSRKPIPAFV